MRLLLCTDGSSYAEQAAQFGALIAHAAPGDVVLLGIAESRGAEARVAAAQARLRETLAAALPGLTLKTRFGRAAEQILAESGEAHYDLIVIGSRGRRGLTRFLLGSTAATLAKHCRAPLLIVKGGRAGLRRVLVCTGGALAGEATARLGGQIAGATGAAVVVLHVMSQLALVPEANVYELQLTAEQAIAAGTREGLHLDRALAIVREAGAGQEPSAKIRRGLVVDEILDEVETGDYDLVVIGAHYFPPETARPKARPWPLLFDDVSDQIVSHCRRPVLVVR